MAVSFQEVVFFTTFPKDTKLGPKKRETQRHQLFYNIRVRWRVRRQSPSFFLSTMRITPLVLLILIGLGLNQATNGQLFYNRIGTLDTTLNGSGYVQIGGGNVYPTRVKQLSDRSILMLGQEGDNVHVVKFRPNGTPDPAFGAGGHSDIPCSACLMKDLVELPDGKLLLAGETNFMQPQQPSDLLLARLNASGSLDTTFGTNGFVQHDLPVQSGQFSDEHMREIALLADGSILAAATTDVSTDHINKQCSGLLVKFLADGSLDASFGTGGFSRTVIGDEATSNSSSWANISVFGNGGIAVAFNARIKDTNVPSGFFQRAILRKYHASGQSDVAFGVKTLDADTINDIAAVGEGTLMLTFNKLTKFDANGQLDATFGTNGTFTFPSQSFPGFLSVQPSGKIYVTGDKVVQNGLNPGQVFRFWPNGMRDLRFGRSGEATINIDHQHLYLGPAFIENNGTLALTGTLAPNNVYYLRLKVQR